MSSRKKHVLQCIFIYLSRPTINILSGTLPFKNPPPSNFISLEWQRDTNRKNWLALVESADRVGSMRSIVFVFSGLRLYWGWMWKFSTFTRKCVECGMDYDYLVTSNRVVFIRRNRIIVIENRDLPSICDKTETFSKVNEGEWKLYEAKPNHCQYVC